MDLKELDSWLATDEGAAWLESQKKPLLNKRDEVLTELKNANGKYSELEQRFKETENALLVEKSAIAKLLIDDELVRLLSNHHVIEAHIPLIAKSLKETHGLTVNADGDTRTVIGNLKDNEGKETTASMADIVTAWANNKSNWDLIRGDLNTGGGAPGSGRGAQSTKNFSGLSGRELANVSDADFKAWQQEQIKQGA